MRLNRDIRPLQNDDGFSLIEIALALFVLSILSILVLSSIDGAERVSITAQAQDGAVVLAYQILQEADALGCGTATGTEPAGTMPPAGVTTDPASQPGALAQVYNRCSWGPSDTNVPYYAAHPPICPTVDHNATIQSIGDTGWFCQNYHNVNYAIRLHSQWTTPAGPGSGGAYNCSFYAAQTPWQVTTTVSMVWTAMDIRYQKSWTRTSAIPPDSLAQHIANPGAICVSGVTAPIAIAVPQTATSGGPTPNGSWFVQHAPGPHGNVWFPFLTPGTYVVAVYQPGTGGWCGAKETTTPNQTIQLTAAQVAGSCIPIS